MKQSILFNLMEGKHYVKAGTPGAKRGPRGGYYINKDYDGFTATQSELQQNDGVLSSDDIDEVMESNTVFVIYRNQNLSSKQLNKAIDKGMDLEVLYKHQKLSPEHIDKAINKGKNLNTLYHGQKLSPENINNAIDKGKYLYDIYEYQKLTSENIDKAIDKGGRNLNSLYKFHKLSPEQINKVIDKGGRGVENLYLYQKLSPEQIGNLKAKNSKINFRYLDLLKKNKIKKSMDEVELEESKRYVEPGTPGAVRGKRGGWYIDTDGKTVSSNTVPELHNTKIVNQLINKFNSTIPSKMKNAIKGINHNYNKGIDTQNEYKMPNGEYTPERKKLHDEIIANFLQGVPSTKKPKAILVAGVPGSGKTSTLKELYNLNKYAYINADDIKELIPEYKGYNAPLIHHESTDIEKRLIKKAIKQNKSIMIDKTFKNMSKAKRILSSLKRKGYNIQMIATQLPTHKSIERAHSRFMKTGRYVPYEMIGEYAPQVNENIIKLKKVIPTKIYNTDIPMGQRPIRIEKMNEKINDEMDNIKVWNSMIESEDDAIIGGLE